MTVILAAVEVVNIEIGSADSTDVAAAKGDATSHKVTAAVAAAAATPENTSALTMTTNTPRRTSRRIASKKASEAKAKAEAKTAQAKAETLSSTTVVATLASTSNSSTAVTAEDETPKKKKIKTAVQEKRLRAFRKNASVQVKNRISRATTQRLYLIRTSDITPFNPIRNKEGPHITFTVLGSTGNVYDVTLCKLPKCTCPDNGKGNLCKHILFVMLKIIGLESSSPLVYQAAYLTDELNELLQLLQNRKAALGLVEANKAVKDQYDKMKKSENNGEEGEGEEDGIKRKKIEGECPVCFDDLLPPGQASSSSSTLITYCKMSCGQNFHSECIKMWATQCGNNPTCPACRQTWIDTNTGGKKEASVFENEGFTNLGSLQGQSRSRDTSTFSNYRGRRRRYSEFTGYGSEDGYDSHYDDWYN